MVCDVAEIAAGVGVVWARRDGMGEPVAAVVPLASSVLTALAPADVAVLSSAVSAVAFVFVPSSALPASPVEESACARCSAVA